MLPNALTGLLGQARYRWARGRKVVLRGVEMGVVIMLAMKDANAPARAADDSITRLSRQEVDQLADDIAVLAARIDAATHQLLAHIRRFDEAKGWARQGALSCAHWLSWRIGIDLPAAREKVRAARALAALPKIDAALARGELSYSKVRAMTRVAGAHNEELLLDMAKVATGAQMEKVVRGLRRVLRPSKSDDERRYVRKRHVPADGMVRIEIKLLPDEAERMWQALRETKLVLAGEMDATAVGSTSRSAAQSTSSKPNLADAAVAMAEAQLARLDELSAGESTQGDDGCDTSSEQPGVPEKSSVPDERRRRPLAERCQLLIHLRADELSQGALRAELHDGTPLEGETLLRLACDAGLVVAKTDERGDVLDIGRLSRSVSAALSRALLIRDRHCQWPGCRHDVFVEAHHLKHWAQGGETTLDNTLLLCRFHHQRAHEGGFKVERTADGQLAFLDPDGRPIEAVPTPAPVEGDPARQLTDRAIDRRTSLPSWDGTPLDLHAAVGGLVWRHERAGLPL